MNISPKHTHPFSTQLAHINSHVKASGRQTDGKREQRSFSTEGELGPGTKGVSLMALACGSFHSEANALLSGYREQSLIQGTLPQFSLSS